MTLFVCKICHDEDRNVTQCSTEFSHHPREFYCKCDICDRLTTTRQCHGYYALREITNGRKDIYSEDTIDPISLEQRLNFG